MALIFHLWNSKKQLLLKSSLLAWGGSEPWVPPLCSLISFHSCNVLTLWYWRIRGQWSEIQLWIKIIKSCLLPAALGLKVDCRWPDITLVQLSCGEFTSILPVSLYSGRWFVMTDGAMPGRAERHKQLIRSFLLECWLSVPAGEWQLRFQQLTAKTKNRTSLSTKDFLKPVLLIPTATKEFCQIQITPEEPENKHFEYSTVFPCTGHF